MVKRGYVKNQQKSSDRRQLSILSRIVIAQILIGLFVLPMLMPSPIGGGRGGPPIHGGGAPPPSGAGQFAAPQGQRTTQKSATHR